MFIRVGLAVIAATVVARGWSSADAHPDHHEEGLLSHWAAGAHEVIDGRLDDVTHTHSARIVGSPGLATVGPTQAATFNGKGDYLLISESIDGARKGLPTREFSVTAWVNLESLTAWGAIVGVMQDNGDAETGWNLGYNDSTFSFALSTLGGDDGDGKLTYLAGSTMVEPGRWYHVAGTYDGQVMRIYVNGRLERESREQSGDILYPARARYTLGCYLDDDEQYPLHGAVHRVKVYSRVLSGPEIEGVVSKNQNLVDYGPARSTALGWLVEPYLQFSTLNSIVVMSETTVPSAMTVEYGPRRPLGYTASMTKAGLIGEVKLEGLEANTDYFYKVIRTTADGQTLESPVRACRTAVPPDRPWSFGIIGDTQRNPAVTKKCAEIAFSMRPNFMLHCGDVVDDGYSKNQWLKDLFEPCKALTAHVPMFPVIGNHERNSHFYYDYFHMPEPEYYYTFRFGNAEFFMIDTNKPVGPGSEQWAWLERDLAKSTAVWKFACHHHPVYSSDNDDHGDTQTGDPSKPPTWGIPKVQELAPLYEKHGIDIVFNGHIHVYERTWPIFQMQINPTRGIRYITSGGGGGGLEEPAPNKGWFSLHVNKAHHVCYAAVFDRTMEFKAFDIEGRMFDSFVLTKDPGR